MKEKLARELLKKFPPLDPERERQALLKLQHFILYDHKGNARCSACGHVFQEYTPIGHNRKRCCPQCGEKVLDTDITKPYKSYIVRSTANVMIFLSAPDDDNLYIRCYALKMYFEHGNIVPKIKWLETQRYVFAENGAARYGRDTHIEGDYKYWWRALDDDWVVRTQIAAPNFYNTYGYSVIGTDAINSTCMRYSMAGEFDYDIGYLRFYRTHKGAERLIKCGFKDVVHDCLSKHCKNPDIDWSQTEVRKMLKISRPAMRLLREKKVGLDKYKAAAKEFPNVPEGRQIEYAKVIGYCYGTLERVCGRISHDKYEVLKYLAKQNATLNDYDDYLDMCQELQYDLSDKVIAFPPHLMAAHDRAQAALDAIKAEKKARELAPLKKKFDKFKKERAELEFSYGEYLIRQPESAIEIIAEGTALSHCVGGYAKRHADGVLTIMFLRKKSEPDKPFYTVEVSNSLKIVQCRGYKNNIERSGGQPKPDDIKEFEGRYAEYLSSVYAKRQKKAKRKKPAMKKLQIGA